MTTRTRNRVLTFTFLILFIPAAAILVIRLAQGYRPDIDSLQLQPRGLLVATSEPDGAQVYLNGKLTTATNNTLNLAPDNYEVEIKKDGFRPWQKTIPVREELVMKTDAYLFRTFPDLRPLTFTGAANPSLSPDGQKVIYAVNEFSSAQDGLWLFDLSDRPLGFPREPKQVVANIYQGQDFTLADYIWSPDAKEILITLTIPATKTLPAKEQNYLLDLSTINLKAKLVEATSILPEIFERWQEEEELMEKAQFTKLPKELQETLKETAVRIFFSPDESKILYTATASATLPDEIIPPLPAPNPQPEERELKAGRIYVYDTEEDKNFFIMEANQLSESKTSETENAPSRTGGASDNESSKANLPEKISSSKQFQVFVKPQDLQWFPTSRHLFLLQKDKVTILEYDNTNHTDVYSGPFENDFAFPFPSADKILILTTLGQDTPANLYAVSLK